MQLIRGVGRSFVGATAVREEWRYATFSDRFGADLLDGLFAIGIALPVYLLIDKPFLGEDAAFGATDVVMIAWLLWNLTYVVGTTGQSWGRRIAGLKVIMRDGEPIGFWRALGRNLFATWVSAPVFYLGFLWVVWDGEKQAWHDKVFGTFVMRRVVL